MLEPSAAALSRVGLRRRRLQLAGVLVPLLRGLRLGRRREDRQRRQVGRGVPVRNPTLERGSTGRIVAPTEAACRTGAAGSEGILQQGSHLDSRCLVAMRPEGDGASTSSFRLGRSGIR